MFQQRQSGVCGNFRADGGVVSEDPRSDYADRVRSVTGGPSAGQSGSVRDGRVVQGPNDFGVRLENNEGDHAVVG